MTAPRGPLLTRRSMVIDVHELEADAVSTEKQSRSGWGWGCGWWCGWRRGGGGRGRRVDERDHASDDACSNVQGQGIVAGMLPGCMIDITFPI